MCMGLLLPMYYTMKCDPWKSGRNVCRYHDKHTDFEKLTIANVVPHHVTKIVFPNGTTAFAEDNPLYNATTLNDLDLINSIKLQWIPSITGEWNEMK